MPLTEISAEDQMPQAATAVRRPGRPPRQAPQTPVEDTQAPAATPAALNAPEPAPAPPVAPVAGVSADKYPQLSPAQEKALDRDGNGAPGGSLGHAVAAAPPEPEPEAGAVLVKGAPPPAPKPVSAGDMCRVRITKAGHGQVHTGRTEPKTYTWGDEVLLPRSVGRALEGKNFGEILD
jgi:hypothetical protein